MFSTNENTFEESVIVNSIIFHVQLMALRCCFCNDPKIRKVESPEFHGKPKDSKFLNEKRRLCVFVCVKLEPHFFVQARNSTILKTNNKKRDFQ